MKTTFGEQERFKKFLGASSEDKALLISTEATNRIGGVDGLLIPEGETAYPEQHRMVAGFKRHDIMECHKHGINLLEINGVK